MIFARTKSAEETQRFAAALAGALQTRDLVLLAGEMGAGKTTFAQGFGRALGITEIITSPTFVLLHTYQASVPLHHGDVYRLEHLQEVIDLGLLELLDEGGIALLEWGDLAAPVLPRDFLEVRLEIGENDDERFLQLAGVGPQWSVREKALIDVIAEWIEQEGQEEIAP